MEIPQVARDVLKVAAPTLLTALLGPFGGLAAALATQALDTFLPVPGGVAPGSVPLPPGVPQPPSVGAATPVEVVNAVEANAANPDLMKALREAEKRLKDYEGEMGFRFAELEAKDRADARRTSVESGLAADIFRLGRQTVLSDSVLTYIVIVGGMVLLSGLVEVRADPTLVTVVFTLFGAALQRSSSRSDGITNFYYGSSKGSTDKNTEITSTMREMGAALGAAAQKQAAAPPVVALPPPPVLQVPSPVPVPAVVPEAGGERVRAGSEAAVPAPSGLLAEIVPSLIVPHRHFPDGVEWYLTGTGISIDGAPPQGTPGKPTTVRAIWARYGDLCCSAARRYGCPVELIVATIATESKGDPNAHREEPQIGDASTGLMQTLLGTAREALGRPRLTQGELRDPETSILAGTAYIAQQRASTHFDPPLVSAAYNAGSIRYDKSPANRWRLHCYPKGTGRHVDNFVAWFNDAMAVSAEDQWCAADLAVPTFGSCVRSSS